MSSKQKSLTEVTPTTKAKPVTPQTKPMPEETKIFLDMFEQINEIIYATCEKIWQKYELRDYTKTTCPECKQPKNPKYDLCYNCFMKAKEQNKT